MTAHLAVSQQLWILDELFSLRTDLFGTEVRAFEREAQKPQLRDLQLNCPEQLGKQGGEENPLEGNG